MYKVFVSIYFLSAYLIGKDFSATVIPIGGIFEGPDQDQLLAFTAAIDIINRNGLVQNHTFKAVPVYIEPEIVVDNVKKSIIGINLSLPFVAMEVACDMLDKGVVGIFTSLSESSDDIVQSVCDAKEIPVIKVNSIKDTVKECCSINIHPEISTIFKAFNELVHYLKWTKYAILYEHFNMDAVSEMLKFSNSSRTIVTIYHLQKNATSGFRDTLKEVRNSGVKNIVLHCSTENLNNVLRQAQEIGIMTKNYNYIISNVDMHTIDLNRYQHSETNITGLQLVDPSSPAVLRASESIQQTRKSLRMKTEPPHIAAWKLKTSSALLIDAVMLLADTLKDTEYFNVSQLSCNSSKNWKYGSTISNYMKMKSFDGLTGLIQFDHKGSRNDFQMNVVSLKEGGLVKIGTWSIADHIQIKNTKSTSSEDDYDSLKNKHLNIMISAQ